MNLSQAVLKTVCYHDIFNYPLTLKEVSNYLMSKKAPEEAIVSILEKMIKSHKLTAFGGYFFLKNRNQIVNLRGKRAIYSAVKLKRVKIYSAVLKVIPTVQFVGISGALSMENSRKNDDIDLVIISSANWLWTTRFLANILLFPVKRNPGSKKTNNRACLNLFLDESDLRIKEENIYQAHEICQLKPLWQRNNAYYRFLKANNWAKLYLPNWKALSINNHQSTIINQKSRGVTQKSSTINNHQSSIIGLLSWIETLFKKLQLLYMKNKISTETIGDSQLFFHPGGTQERVLKEYEKRLKNLKIYGQDI